MDEPRERRFRVDLSREELEEIVHGLEWAENEGQERNGQLCHDLQVRLGGMLAAE